MLKVQVNAIIEIFHSLASCKSFDVLRFDSNWLLPTWQWKILFKTWFPRCFMSGRPNYYENFTQIECFNSSGIKYKKKNQEKIPLFFQVVLRWALERGISLVTKSCNTDRLGQNLDLFSFQLSDQDRKYVEIKKKYYSLISLFYFYPHQTNWRDGPKSEIQ